METANYCADPATQPNNILSNKSENQDAPLIPQLQSQKFKQILQRLQMVFQLPTLETQEQQAILKETELCAPLVLITIMALICLISAYHWIQVFFFIIAVMNLGAILVSFNAVKCGVNLPLLTISTLVGYCMLPISTAQFIIFCIPCIQKGVQIGLVLIGVGRATYCAYSLLKYVASEDKLGLIAYPIGLYYFYIGYLVLSCGSY